MNVVIAYPNSNPTHITKDEFVIHAPIAINSPADFVSLGFPGDGTSQNPYRIEGLNVTSTSLKLIQVNNINSYFIIANNLLNGLYTAEFGISLYNSVNGNILNNVVSNTIISTIHLYLSEDNLVINNTVSGNTQFGSINLLESTNNTIASNTASFNADNGIVLEDSHLNVLNNNVVSDNQGGGIHVTSTSSSNNITNNTVYDNSFAGIHIGGASNNNSIIGNEIYGNNNGIALGESSQYNVIEENYLHFNYGSGINIYDTSYTSIIANTIHDSGYSGIELINSENNIISQNSCSSNYFGEIHLHESPNNIIHSNIVTQNTYAGGIYIVVNSNNNTITNNQIEENEVGIVLEADSDQNIIHNNTIHDSFAGITISDSHNSNIAYNQIVSNEIGYTITNGNGNKNATKNYLGFNFFIYNEDVVWFEALSEENIVEYNDFGFSNLNSGPPHAFDDGANNIFKGNYWANWEKTTPFLVSGSSGNYDSSPNLSPNHFGFYDLVIQGDEIISGIVDVTWETIQDMFEHSIQDPSLYYYINGDDKNLNFISYLTNPNAYSWNTQDIRGGFGINLFLAADDEYGLVTSTTSEKYYIGFKDEVHPTIQSIPDVIVTSNEDSKELIWNVFDENPWQYEIIMARSLGSESISYGLQPWEFNTISFFIDGFNNGDYVFTLTVIDVSGNEVSMSVDVTIDIGTPSESTSVNLIISIMGFKAVLIATIVMMPVYRRLSKFS